MICIRAEFRVSETQQGCRVAVTTGQFVSGLTLSRNRSKKRGMTVIPVGYPDGMYRVGPLARLNVPVPENLVARVLIVAYGNPLRSDDGAAWKAAEELSQQQLLGHVEKVMNHQLTPELALAVSGASRVVFVDAAREGVPGEIASVALKPQQGSCVFTHQFSPAAILSAARQVYGKCPDGFAVSI
jgi:hydrogenase maturation protease